MTVKKADKLIDRYVKEFHADVTRRDVRKEMMCDLGLISMGLDFIRKSDVPTEYVRVVHEEDLTPVQIGFEAWLTATFPGIMPGDMSAPPPPPVQTTVVENSLTVEHFSAILFQMHKAKAETATAKAETATAKAEAEKARAALTLVFAELILALIALILAPCL
jgi:hypothetical protein